MNYQIFIIVYILNLIAFIFLAREPRRSIKAAEDKLKLSFKYYCEPPRRATLSSEERKMFDENFSYRISHSGTHRKAYYRSGIYHNQERTYEIGLFIEDLKNGMSYYLTYKTNRIYEDWDGYHGVEIVTRGGNFTRR